MDEYRKPYLALFHATEEALAALDVCNFNEARKLLVDGQRKAEDEFIAGGAPNSEGAKVRVIIKSLPSGRP